MCYYIIQNIIETIGHLVPRLLLQRFGRWSLGTNLDPGTSAPAHGMPSRLPPRDCVSRHIMAPAGPSVRSNVRLSVVLRCCVIAWAIRRPKKGDQSGSLHGPRRLRPATSRYRTRSSHGFDLCRLAAPRLRIRECLTTQVYLASQSNAISHIA